MANTDWYMSTNCQVNNQFLCDIQYSVIFLVFQQYLVYKIIVSECHAIYRVVTCDREGLQSEEG